MRQDLAIRLVVAAIVVGAMVMTRRYRDAADRRGGAVSRSVDRSWIRATLALGALGLYGGLLLFLVAPTALSWSRIGLPTVARWGGVALLLAAALGGRWVLANLGENVTPTSAARAGARLVTSGPYRWVRHPLYSNGLLIIAGATMASDSWVPLAGGVVAMSGLVARIPDEEAALQERFGDEYRQYSLRTGRLLPRLRR